MKALMPYLIPVAIAAVVGLVFNIGFKVHAHASAEVARAATIAQVQKNDLTILSASDGFVAINGIALMDEYSGTPAAPYIKFTEANGRVRTAQLIYVHERGCLASAGNFPCVPNYPQLKAYPKLTTGQPIHAEGYIREDRLFVTAISERN